MNKQIMIMTIISIFAIVSCKPQEKQVENPFFAAYTTPFEVPPFDKIDTADYMPAFIEGMKQGKEDIAAITSNSETPTFENTILALDQSGKLLEKVSMVFFNLTSAHTNDQMQAIARDVSPLLSQYGDDIAMNPVLFERIHAVFEARNEVGLDDQQIRVIEKYHNDFIRRGAGLPADKQDELRKINEQLSMKALQFGENLLAENNKNFKLIIEDSADLAGLPQGVVDAAAEAAKSAEMEGKWMFTLSKPSLIPFLQYADKRELREKIYRGYFMRGNNDNANDNKILVAEMSKLRAQKANLLGYQDYASYVLAENMAAKTENVDRFLNDLYVPALKVAKNELAEMQVIADKEGAGVKLQSWDWWYYAEKLRKEKYDLDENELKPYFVLENVRDGMFAVAGKLYGITFTKVNNLPIYHADVETFEVKEADGSHLGILYMDYYPRESKGGGAWCTGFNAPGYENGKKIDPIVSIVCNFTKPSGDTPALLSWDETTTLFHEFGHGLHGLFTDGKYKRTAGNVPQDYVELPSQIMENWAGMSEVLRMYAKHYKTGEVIPDALIVKIQNSSLFNQGFETVEYIAASILDMEYQKLQLPADIETLSFEKAAMDKIGLIDEIIPRYRSTYFSHIFDGGYAAGYYVYIWAAVLDSDAFEYFKASGDIFNKDLAASFRKHCLAECGSDEGMIQYVKFRGQEPTVAPLLQKRGLN